MKNALKCATFYKIIKPVYTLISGSVSLECKAVRNLNVWYIRKEKLLAKEERLSCLLHTTEVSVQLRVNVAKYVLHIKIHSPVLCPLHKPFVS